MRNNELECKIIEYSAPTLAGMKSASLFTFFCDNREEILKDVSRINKLINERGLFLEILLFRENAALLYIYRKEQLQEELNQAQVKELIAPYGYKNTKVESCISHLKKRLKSASTFPHEIGIFLGYPIEDVHGFIKHKGKNCECGGLWKVYCNANEKQKLFCKYKKCTSIYLQVFKQGKPLQQMTLLFTPQQ